MFIKRFLKMSPTLTSDSHNIYLTSGHDIMTLQTQRLIRELTHSPSPSEFGDNSQVFSLWQQKVEVEFTFFCQSLSQDHLLGHTSCSLSFWVHLARNKRTKGVWDWTLPKRISFWPLHLAGTSKKVSCTSLTLWHAMRDDLTGAYNNVKASIADWGSSSTSVLVSMVQSQKQIQKNKPNLTLR